ncbi:unnamed protein product, partial [Prorocentrum cordatum]
MDTRSSQEIINDDRFEAFERKQRIKNLARQSVQIAQKLHLQNILLCKGEQADQQLDLLEETDSDSDSLGAGAHDSDDPGHHDPAWESSGARAATEAAGRLLERQRAAFGRIEESLSVQPGAARRRSSVHAGAGGAARAAALAGLSPAERRMAGASAEIARRRQREESQHLYSLKLEKIEACSTRKQDRLCQATHVRAQEARKRRNQMLRARRELERDEVRQVDRRAEEFEEKLQRAARWREERSASPVKAVGDSGEEGGDALVAWLGPSHSMYQDTILKWQQRELEADGRARAKLGRTLGESWRAPGGPDDGLAGGPARHPPSEASRRGGEAPRAARRGAGLARDTSLPACGVGAAARVGAAMARSASAVAPARAAAAAR